ncbi:MAG: VanZ family protein [Rikenellaceae bacterium]
MQTLTQIISYTLSVKKEKGQRRIMTITKRTVTTITITYTVLVTTLSLVKLTPITHSVDVVGLDKLVHLLFYFGLTTLLLTQQWIRGRSITTKRVVVIATAAALYGGVMEILQHFIGRECSLLDMMANSLGALLGAVIFRLPVVSKLIDRTIEP